MAKWTKQIKKKEKKNSCDDDGDNKSGGRPKEFEMPHLFWCVCTAVCMTLISFKIIILSAKKTNILFGDENQSRIAVQSVTDDDDDDDVTDVTTI